MSLLSAIVIALVGVCITGLGLAIQNNGLNIKGILTLCVGLFVIFLAVFLAM